MKLILLAALSLILLSMGCLASPSHEHMCPDGIIVKAESQCPEYHPLIITTDPQDFRTIILKNNQSSYVMAGGEVQTEVLINKGEIVWMLGDYIPTDQSTSERHDSLKVINKTGNLYLINFSAPQIPSEFYFGATRRKRTGPEESIFVYNLTVIEKVENEALAYSIVDKFMRIKTNYGLTCEFPCVAPSFEHFLISFSPYGHMDNWKITSKNATLRNDGNWEVFMEATYDKCGIDWDMDVCLRNNTMTGHFIISGKTGQIIG